jgi:Transcription factor S-II (TFIIS)
MRAHIPNFVPVSHLPICVALCAPSALCSLPVVACPKCDHQKAYFVQLQTRSADEPMTIFYCCVSCSFKWKEG